MRRVIGMCLALITVLSACGGRPTASVDRWQEQYDLGVRYLSEGNYEEAIIAFNAAIEIDPKRSDGYISLADAYVGMGDIDKAEAVLQEALNLLGNESDLLKKISELQSSVENENVFEQLPNEFIFSSGAGGWRTTISINEDGTFAGKYLDSNMGDTGNSYPNGTTYVCNFDGRFSAPEKVSEYIYTMSLEHLNVMGTIGEEYFEDGVRYIYSNPYGLDDASEFLIYLPGCPLSEVAPEFLSWVSIDAEVRSKMPEGIYGIYNVGGMEGFLGQADNTLWSRDYEYTYGVTRSALWPSYSGKSHLVFWPETGASTLDLSFYWPEDGQYSFVATDAKGTGDYTVSLDFGNDQETVLISVKSHSEVDLTPWGGTADGTLTAEYMSK